MDNDLSRGYVDIKPTICVLCKAATFKNFTKGKKYTAKATQRIDGGSYTNYLVEGNDKGVIALTIERLMDTFTVCFN